MTLKIETLVDHLFYDFILNLEFAHYEDRVERQYTLNASRMLDVLTSLEETDESYKLSYEIKAIGGTIDNSCSLVRTITYQGVLPANLAIKKGSFEFFKDGYSKDFVVELQKQIDNLYDRYVNLIKFLNHDDTDN